MSRSAGFQMSVSIVGKRLAGRNVSGDLTGFSRVKFDLPGLGPSGSGCSTARSTT